MAVGLAVMVGCGEGGQVSDADIVSALKLEQTPDRPAYAVGGDPFCEVSDDLLNDSEEVEIAKQSDDLGLVLTDSDESVGIQGVPPFDPQCARKARQQLDELE
jgi:hypothetical protein